MEIVESKSKDSGPKPTKPINYINLCEELIRIRKLKCAEDLVKQLTIDGSNNPIIRFKLKNLLSESMFEPLLKKFRKEPELFLEDFREALINVAKFIEPELNKYLLRDDNSQKIIHIIPDNKDAEFLIPLRDNFEKDLTQDQGKIFWFKGRFMSLGLERMVEFEKMMFQCLVCGHEFEIIPYYRKTREKYQTPKFCINKRCKAKYKSDFALLEKKSIKYEKRTFTIIDLENKDIINEIRCYISHCIDYFNEKAKHITCNDEIEILGFLKMDTADLFSNKEDQTLFYYIEVLDIESGHTNDINPKIVKRIKKDLAKDSLYCNKIIDSIHPYSQNIINFFPIKLCYSLGFITSDSYTNIRNGLNSIVAGHSGTMKSKIAMAFKEKLGANNFGIIYGKNTTSKGLVPVAQRNNNEKNLVKRYGAIPYYNKKHFVIDEAQYLYAKDPDALECFKCYEEGEITRALDGTTISAPAKGTVSFALNYRSEDEAYDFSKRLVENLGFPEDQKSVLDRFDLHYRIPRNTEGIVKVLVKRGTKAYKPKFLESDEIIFNYFIEAKRQYSEGIDIPIKIERVIDSLYDSIITYKKKYKNVILNPREPDIIKRTLKGIAAMRLRKEVNDSDLEYFKKYLINTVIPFQDNDFIIKERTIDIAEIFQNSFDLLTELYVDFSVGEHIKFLREYLETNYFQGDDQTELGKEFSRLENFISNETNLSNTKYKTLLAENQDFIEKKRYIMDLLNNKTHFINKTSLKDKIKGNIIELFKENNVRQLEIRSIVQIIELETTYSKDLIEKTIDSLVKDKVFIKKGDFLNG
ncbi:MAG: hypothetical protein ACFE8A_13315 [Candidatus Hodarchaeota archaeon]